MEVIYTQFVYLYSLKQGYSIIFCCGHITKFVCNLGPDCKYFYSRTLKSWHTGDIYFTFLLFLICLTSYVIILVFQTNLCYLVVIYISIFSTFLLATPIAYAGHVWPASRHLSMAALKNQRKRIDFIIRYSFSYFNCL
jgi:hypothetical protein